MHNEKNMSFTFWLSEEAKAQF